MAQTKPDISTQWGATGAITDPGAGKTSTGWVAEIPPHPYQNWWQNRADQFMTHINEQGIAVWDIATDYPTKGWAKGSNGLVYESLQNPNANNDPVTSTGFWSVVAGGEFSDRTITIPNGSTHAEIQTFFNSVGRYIHYGTIVTIEFANDLTIDIAANKLVTPDFSGGGILVITAVTKTGAGAKAVKITGEGAPAFDEFPPYSDQASQRYLFLVSNAGFTQFGDIEFETTGAVATTTSAAIGCLNSPVSVSDCVITNAVTTGALAAGVFAFSDGSIDVEDTVFSVPIAFGGIAAAVVAASGGSFTTTGISGTGDYGHHVQDSSGSRSSSTFVGSIAADLVIRGEIYS